LGKDAILTGSTNRLDYRKANTYALLKADNSRTSGSLAKSSSLMAKERCWPPTPNSFRKKGNYAVKKAIHVRQ
jgi:hypothetical protein